jgi:hypothetical protein
MLSRSFSARLQSDDDRVRRALIPHLGANCPACGVYNSAAETTCYSCQRPLAHANTAPPRRRRFTGRRVIGLVLAALMTIGVTGYASDVLIPGPPVAMQFDPDFVKVGPAETTALHVNAVDARGHVLAPELTWTSDGGSVTASGTFTVPAKAGSYRVTATTADGLSATANVLVEPGPVDRIDVGTVGTIKPSELATLTATVRDAYGNAIEPPRVTWSVSPATASIDQDGKFRTRTAGTYTIEARSGAVAGTTNLIVVCPTTHNDTFRGVTFSVVCGSTGDIWIAGALTTSDTKTILATIDRDLTDLETDFAIQMNGRFRMYAYASSRSFAQALTALFPGATGDVTGVYFPPDSIVVDWEGANSDVPQSAIRHELSHLFVERASGRLGGREIPAWFDEGLATVEQYAISGSAWEATTDRYCAASAAAGGTMPSLASITSFRDFQALDGRLGYIVGAQAVTFIKDDIGMDGIRKMLSAVGIGHFWDDAYREVSGKTWASFVASFPERVRALAPRYPGVAFAADSPDGPGASYVLYGYDPGGAVRVTIENTRFGGSSTKNADPSGCLFGFLAGNWPSGSYTFTASGRAGLVTSTLRK